MQVFSTAYFGPIAYYAELIQAQQPIVEAKEHFVKQTIRTRCEILGPNGVQTLSVPVRKINGNKTAVDALELLDDGWRKMHWKSIETAYSSAAYFDYYGMEIKEILMGNQSTLLELNDAILQRVLMWLDVEKTIGYTSEYQVVEDPKNDFRSVAFDSSSSYIHAPYHQVFKTKENCVFNLSILDLLLNEGPMAHNWMLQKMMAQ